MRIVERFANELPIERVEVLSASHQHLRHVVEAFRLRAAAKPEHDAAIQAIIADDRWRTAWSAPPEGNPSSFMRWTR
jgi:hypothetical protein